MRRSVVPLILVVLLSLQTQYDLIAHDAYTVAHFKNHREAYIVWRKAHQEKLIGDHMTLVHLDAHHDMDCMVGAYYETWLTTNQGPPEAVEGFTNATFIDAAINEGLISEIWWVLPDYMYWGERFDLPETFVRNGEPRQFYKYVRFCDCQLQDGHVVCTLMDIHEVAPPLPTLDKYVKTEAKVHFVTLRMLPKFEEEVLLDIDADYFINTSHIEQYPHYFYDDSTLRPWISVNEVAEIIAEIQIKSRVVTVAQSPDYTHEDYYYLSWLTAVLFEEYLSQIYYSSTSTEIF